MRGGDGHGPVQDLLQQVWHSVSRIPPGDVADYIPELAKADPGTLGLGLATPDGAVYSAGDLVPFTIQSVSKPFVYALALADSGSEAVLSRVGTEPTGDPFNTISLDQASGRAENPMVNAGAIVTATMVAGATRAEQFERILAGLSAFAGRPLELDAAVYASERDTGDRNRAIAYLMRSAGLLDADVDDQVELYFRQCSVLVDARDLAVMAATLANAGVNPLTGTRVVPREVVAPVLTVMTTCGMYDYAGEWLYRVGLPAKSGVSGAVVAALPGQLGIAAHSPGLDERGNSVRGVAACEQLSQRLGLHLLLPREPARSGVRRSYRGDTVRSKRERRSAERSVLDAEGGSIAVHELAGDLQFAGAEGLVRLVLGADARAGWQVLDMRRVTRMDRAAAALIAGLGVRMGNLGQVLAVVRPAASGARRVLAAALGGAPVFADVDSALEWCENALLARHGLGATSDAPIPITEQEVLVGLPASSVDAIAERCTTRSFPAGSTIFDEGDPSDGLYFVASGLVSADVGVPGSTERRRVSSTPAGSSFGELALMDQRPRATRIVAVEPTVCQVLSPEAFEDLQSRHPRAGTELTLALVGVLSQRLRDATRELGALHTV